LSDVVANSVVSHLLGHRLVEQHSPMVLCIFLSREAYLTGEKDFSPRTPFPVDVLPRSPNGRKIRPATKPDGLVIAKKPHPRFLEIGHDSNELAFSMVLPNRSVCVPEQIKGGRRKVNYPGRKLN